MSHPPTTDAAPPRSSRRARRIGLAAAVTAGLALSTGLVFQSSYAAYSARAQNPNNNWTTGTVTLTNDDVDGAIFSFANSKPGDRVVQCITVASTGTLPAEVRLYAKQGDSYDSELAGAITATITQGSDASADPDPSCTKFSAFADTQGSVYSGSLANLVTTRTNYGTGITTANSWKPTGTSKETRTYRFELVLDPNAPDTTAGKTVRANFVWESQNT